MSRVDKRVHQEQVVGTAKDASVRLFAFANTRSGYQVVFAPEMPLVILKTKRSETEQHPCKQWEPFSSIVFKAQPNTTHAVYVADTTSLIGPQFEQEEAINGAAIGPLLKRLSNHLSKLNPHNGTLLAAGLSAHLALKYMLVGEKTLGHSDRLFQKVILVCPSSLASLKELGSAVQQRRLHQTGYPKPEVVVLVKDAAQVPVWEAWHRELEVSGSLFASFAVSSNLTPSVFAAIARSIGVEADGTSVDTAQRFQSPRVYRIDFILSKQTKRVEQVPTLSPLDTLGYDVDLPVEEDCTDGNSGRQGDLAEGTGTVYSSGRCCDSDGDLDHNECDSCHSIAEGSMLISGISGLVHWKDPVRVMLEGRVLNLSKGLVGTTEGRIAVEGLHQLVEVDKALAKHVARSRGAPVALATALVRDAEGYQRLRALEVSAMTRAQEKNSMTVGGMLSEIPDYNVSALQQHYGAVLIRGRKCALVRDLSGARDDLFIPHAPHSEVDETATECAIRALCEGCQVSSDNFYFPSYLPPVVYYEKVGEEDGCEAMRCVTLYAVLAVNPPPRGPASDAVEDPSEPEEPYDWVSFPRAMTMLHHVGAKEALQEIQRLLQRAAAASLYKAPTGCGLFGESVASGIAASMATPLVNMEDMEILTVVCPGDHGHELLPSIQRALREPDVTIFTEVSTRATIEAAAAAARNLHGRNTLVVYLDTEADVESYCTEQMEYFTEERGVRVRFLTVLLPSTADAMTDLTIVDDGGQHGVLADSLMAAVRVSDALVTLEPAASLSACSRAIISCATTVNRDLDFYVLGTQKPMIVQSVREPCAQVPGLLRVEMPEAMQSIPVAPAALAYLTQSGSLDVFYEAGSSVLLMVQGDLWVSTRQEANAWVSLDSASRCLNVEGTLWEGASTNEGRRNNLTLWIWCTEEGVAKVKSTAEALMSQLLWNAQRDGADMTKVKDPLPAWDW